VTKSRIAPNNVILLEGSPKMGINNLKCWKPPPMLDQYSKRKKDLLITLKNYSTEVFKQRVDANAIEIFNSLIKMELKEKYHIELVNHINNLIESS